ncbi:RrF2 family transcriptional regulator [Gaetbulibacter aestuarii]|uniref:Rrf2 family transcriptional regulator n=1 Tax=Gaetbulibacter aestuarii TaxID=1502358 RepID=A0ABW7N2E5_9FLAO
MFSKACEYGIKASIFIAVNSSQNRRVNPKEIAKEINSPQAFTAKILQDLVRHNIIKSVKGAHGGFEIEKEKIASVKLSQIVNAIDGDAIFNGCGLGMETCNAKRPCPMHDKFKVVRDELKHMLEHTTLEELAFSVQTGETFFRV